MDLLKQRFCVVMGKGGVGKSLVCALTTRFFLARGERVLLVQVSTRDPIAAYLGCEPATEQIREVTPGLFAVSIQPAAAMREYVLMQVKLPIIYRLVFGNRAVRYFLKAVPALNDLVVLGKIIYHLQERDAAGSFRYDRVIVDAPATGHGLFLLGLPTVMTRAVSSGPIHREASNMLDILTDPGQCAVILVTLPEEMPVSETLDTYRTLTRDYGIPVAGLVVNQVMEPLFEDADAGRLERLRELPTAPPPLREAARIGEEALLRRRHSLGFLETLRKALPLPAVILPRVFSEEIGPAEIAPLAETFAAQLGGRDG